MLKVDFDKQINECINKNLEAVKIDKWRNKYHIMAPIGWINDPNGLCEFNGKYHCYYQYSPLTQMGGLKFWGHSVSNDLVNWEDKGVALYPDIDEDRDGVYSGSAFVKNDTIYFFYTGNVKYKGEYDYILTGREQNVILVTSKDGINFSEKRVVLKNSDFPKDMSLHVRDPKVWEEDGVYYMVLGARTTDNEGCILLYKSDNLYNWEFVSVPAGKQDNMGYMWECPDIFKLDNNDILMFSPQGIDSKGYKYNNIYQCGYAKGKFNDDKKEFKFDEFIEIDRGFDFYAPQTFEDSKGRRIVIGWMGVPDAIEHKNPTINNFWQHQLTIPRELVLKNNKLYQLPIDELKKLRIGNSIKKDVDLNKGSILEIFESNTFELNIDFRESNEFEIILREDCKLSFSDNVFKLELGKSGYGRDMRAVEIDYIYSIKIFSDNSSLEIFLNNGEEVFSTRIYNDSVDSSLILKGNGIATVEKWNY
ncbi:glycoside hydrolase family 32 protein [uncultured Clostridium sp.]|uniref:glycoside hydrolase family 32 protein n=1 Tax=uncultured Clostridium sp. TaxID=59620 RepID=UPI0026ED3C5D|nr:glycoside hydrolase family 32 protein [uncultured Clostridium sp.]